MPPTTPRTSSWVFNPTLSTSLMSTKSKSWRPSLPDSGSARPLPFAFRSLIAPPLSHQSSQISSQNLLSSRSHSQLTSEWSEATPRDTPFPQYSTLISCRKGTAKLKYRWGCQMVARSMISSIGMPRGARCSSIRVARSKLALTWLKLFSWISWRGSQESISYRSRSLVMAYRFKKIKEAPQTWSQIVQRTMKILRALTKTKFILMSGMSLCLLE